MDLLREAGIDRSSRVRHQCGEALQVGTARQAPHSQDASSARGRRLPAWLLEELATVRPAVIVALGATAARSVSGLAAPIARLRGQAMQTGDGAAVVVTYHPAGGDARPGARGGARCGKR